MSFVRTCGERIRRGLCGRQIEVSGSGDLLVTWSVQSEADLPGGGASRSPPEESTCLLSYQGVHSAQ